MDNNTQSPAIATIYFGLRDLADFIHGMPWYETPAEAREQMIHVRDDLRRLTAEIEALLEE